MCYGVELFLLVLLVLHCLPHIVGGAVLDVELFLLYIIILSGSVVRVLVVRLLLGYF